MTAKSDLPPFRPCDLCGGVDQDPRHSFAGLVHGTTNEHFEPDAEVREKIIANIDAQKLSSSEAFAVRQAFEDTTSSDRHIDCCAEAGCPNAGKPGDCGPTAEAAAGKTGEGMRKAALSLSKGQ